MNTNNLDWYQQELNNPLFLRLQWERPQNRQQAGKLLIAGGSNSFAAPAEAYNESLLAGAGVVRVLLPENLRKVVGNLFESTEFAPSTKSGGFAQNALSDFITLSDWSDGVLLPGNLGKNSETSILLESFIRKYSGQLTLTGGVLEHFNASPKSILNRPNSLLVVSISELQKIVQAEHFEKAVTSSMDLLYLIDVLQDFTRRYQANVATLQSGVILMAVEGKVSSTKMPASKIPDFLKIAAYGSVWWLQNPKKTFEALTTCCLDIGEQNS